MDQKDRRNDHQLDIQEMTNSVVEKFRSRVPSTKGVCTGIGIHPEFGIRANRKTA
jgi:hypothetical protein